MEDPEVSKQRRSEQVRRLCTTHTRDRLLGNQVTQTRLLLQSSLLGWSDHTKVKQIISFAPRQRRRRRRLRDGILRVLKDQEALLHGGLGRAWAKIAAARGIDV
uniref:Uncharacterized protein n=1 Tax=Ananas comosus var. bracteatus TaxID=296719 RepID=A0A6V7NSS2_ANACO|nr:unnamed protein product [Ananas comosus var. bracteatus]